MDKRRFEYVAGTSSKFWEVETSVRDAIIRFGRIGAEGTVQVKSFGHVSNADHYVHKMISEKLAKGYREVSLFGVRSSHRMAADAVRRVSEAAAVPAPVTPPAPVGPRRRAIQIMDNP